MIFGGENKDWEVPKREIPRVSPTTLSASVSNIHSHTRNVPFADSFIIVHFLLRISMLTPRCEDDCVCLLVVLFYA